MSGLSKKYGKVGESQRQGRHRAAGIDPREARYLDDLMSDALAMVTRYAVDIVLQGLDSALVVEEPTDTPRAIDVRQYDRAALHHHLAASGSDAVEASTDRPRPGVVPVAVVHGSNYRVPNVTVRVS